MRFGAKANHVRRLREMASKLTEEAEMVDAAEEEPLLWSVLLGPPGIQLARRWVSVRECHQERRPETAKTKDSK